MSNRYAINYTNKFRKDLKICKKRGYNISLFQEVSQLLETTGTLPPEYRPHKLSGKYEGLSGNAISNQTGCWYGIRTIQN